MSAPERTSYAEIVAAGRELLESSGLAGVTMQAVADQVGVRAPSLYKRIRDRQALLVAVAGATVDDLANRLEVIGPDVRALICEYRAYAHERPEGFRLMFSAIVPQEVLERAVAPILEATTAIVGQEEALDAARLVTAWATGFLQMELAGAFRLGGDVNQAFTYGLDHLLAGF